MPSPSALLIALLAASPPVQRPHAEPPTLALRWSVPEGSRAEDGGACPGRAQVIERIAAQGVGERIGGWVPDTHAQAELDVAVVIEREADGWRAELALTNADGRATRSFRASGCSALADATALIVAVTLDPIAVASQLSLGSGPEPSESPTPSEPAPSEPELPDLGPSEPREDAGGGEGEGEGEGGLDLDLDPSEPLTWPAGLQLGLAVHGGGGWGPVPGLAGLLGGRVGLVGERWRADLGGRWTTPRRVSNTAGGAGIIDAWVVEVRGCFAPTVGPRGRIELPLCPGVELGRVRGRGVAPTSDPSEQAFTWIAPGLSQGLAWAPVERFAVGVELGIGVPLTRGRFVVAEVPVTELARVSGRALLSLELRLP